MTNVSGRATISVTVDNLWTDSILNVTPSDLLGSASGSATIFVQTSPRPLRELLGGKSTQFVWKGRFYGDGLIDVSLRVSASFTDGQSETTGIVNCNRIAIGNADPNGAPTATSRPSDPTPTKTPRVPTPPPTATAVLQRPTRTPRLDPTSTPRLVPTSTPTRTSATRPTRTPLPLRPTRTPIGQPTSISTRVLPTRTPTAPQPTRTAVAVRPTRTPASAPPPRPTRTPNIPPPTATPRDPISGGGLAPSCSLRRNGDFVSVTMVVDNRSGEVLRDVRASTLLLDPEGGALFFDRTGPSPGTVHELSNGMSTAFQWTGRLSEGGTMGFSAFATANSSSGPLQTAAIDCGVTSSDLGPFDTSTFAGECSISPAHGEIAVQIRNGSRETLTNIQAFFEHSSGLGSGTVSNLRGPAPRSVQTLASGARRELVFGGTFLGSGEVTLQFKGTAVRSNGQGISTLPISCSATLGGSGGNLPDLGVDSNDLQQSIEIQTQTFTAQSCAVVEGCVDGIGQRKLLRFNTTTPNYGPGDVFLGNPVGNPNFVFSACHQHYHFQEYADYRLLDMGGNIVARGHKQAFCLVDLWEPPGLNGDPHAQFTNCGFQGISAGWADVYNRGLDCQWIDITAVPSGRYVLEVQINPAHVIRESSYDNNVGRAEVTVP